MKIELAIYIILLLFGPSLPQTDSPTIEWEINNEYSSFWPSEIITPTGTLFFSTQKAEASTSDYVFYTQEATQSQSPLLLPEDHGLFHKMVDSQSSLSPDVNTLINDRFLNETKNLQITSSNLNLLLNVTLMSPDKEDADLPHESNGTNETTTQTHFHVIEEENGHKSSSQTIIRNLSPATSSNMPVENNHIILSTVASVPVTTTQPVAMTRACQPESYETASTLNVRPLEDQRVDVFSSFTGKEHVNKTEEMDNDNSFTNRAETTAYPNSDEMGITKQKFKTSTLLHLILNTRTTEILKEHIYSLPVLTVTSLPLFKISKPQVLSLGITKQNLTTSPLLPSIVSLTKTTGTVNKRNYTLPVLMVTSSSLLKVSKPSVSFIKDKEINQSTNTNLSLAAFISTAYPNLVNFEFAKNVQDPQIFSSTLLLSSTFSAENATADASKKHISLVKENSTQTFTTFPPVEEILIKNVDIPVPINSGFLPGESTSITLSPFVSSAWLTSFPKPYGSMTLNPQKSIIIGQVVNKLTPVVHNGIFTSSIAIKPTSKAVHITNIMPQLTYSMVTFLSKEGTGSINVTSNDISTSNSDRLFIAELKNTSVTNKDIHQNSLPTGIFKRKESLSTSGCITCFTVTKSYTFSPKHKTSQLILNFKESKLPTHKTPQTFPEISLESSETFASSAPFSPSSTSFILAVSPKLNLSLENINNKSMAEYMEIDLLDSETATVKEEVTLKPLNITARSTITKISVPNNSGKVSFEPSVGHFFAAVSLSNRSQSQHIQLVPVIDMHQKVKSDSVTINTTAKQITSLLSEANSSIFIMKNDTHIRPQTTLSIAQPTDVSSSTTGSSTLLLKLLEKSKIPTQHADHYMQVEEITQRRSWFSMNLAQHPSVDNKKIKDSSMSMAEGSSLVTKFPNHLLLKDNSSVNIQITSRTSTMSSKFQTSISSSVYTPSQKSPPVEYQINKNINSNITSTTSFPKRHLNSTRMLNISNSWGPLTFSIVKYPKKYFDRESNRYINMTQNYFTVTSMTKKSNSTEAMTPLNLSFHNATRFKDVSQPGTSVNLNFSTALQELFNKFNRFPNSSSRFEHYNNSFKVFQSASAVSLQGTRLNKDQLASQVSFLRTATYETNATFTTSAFIARFHSALPNKEDLVDYTLSEKPSNKLSKYSAVLAQTLITSVPPVIPHLRACLVLPPPFATTLSISQGLATQKEMRSSVLTIEISSAGQDLVTRGKRITDHSVFSLGKMFQSAMSENGKRISNPWNPSNNNTNGSVFKQSNFASSPNVNETGIPQENSTHTSNSKDAEDVTLHQRRNSSEIKRPLTLHMPSQVHYLPASSTSFERSKLFHSKTEGAETKLRPHILQKYEFQKTVFSLPEEFLSGVAVVSDEMCKTGNYTAQMTLNLGKELAPGDLIPAQGKLDVHIKLETNNSEIKLEIRSCCLSPTLQPDDFNSTCCKFTRQPFISKGIRLLHSGKSKSASFTIQVFQMINYSTVYLHCEISLCLSNRSECEMKCFDHRNKDTEDTDQRIFNSAGNVISFGPVLKKKEEAYKRNKDFDLMKRILLFLGSAAGTSLLMFLLLLIWIIHRRRVQNRHNSYSSGISVFLYPDV